MANRQVSVLASLQAPYGLGAPVKPAQLVLRPPPPVCASGEEGVRENCLPADRPHEMGQAQPDRGWERRRRGEPKHVDLWWLRSQDRKAGAE